MSLKSQHTRLLLSKNEGGVIAFCETCDVLELEIGAVSLRVSAASLEAINQLISEAAENMRTYKRQQDTFKSLAQMDMGLH